MTIMVIAMIVIIHKVIRKAFHKAFRKGLRQAFRRAKPRALRICAALPTYEAHHMRRGGWLCECFLRKPLWKALRKA